MVIDLMLNIFENYIILYHTIVFDIPLQYQYR